jgi:cholesterol oxidase
LNDWERVMPAHYETAKRMLGATTNRPLGPADLRLQELATSVGAESSFYRTEVGVFFGDAGDEPGTTYPDPYFAGEGPARKSCIACGGCMVGCRHDAKNTLDKNYLHLAEKKGAELLAESKVVDVRPLLEQADGSAGYEIAIVSLAKGSRGQKRLLTCRGVVFAASSLGTQDLLFRFRDVGSLPRISESLGTCVRTNAESLIGVRYPGSAVDLSLGTAIGSGVYIDEHTHIEVVRYPEGSDAMGLMATVMARGRSGRISPLHWLGTLIGLLLRRPFAAIRAFSPFGWARETMIFLCMQTLEGHLTMRLKRRWYWPFSKHLTTHGEKIPTYIPAAHDFAIKAAAATGGIAQTTLTEVLLNVPMTAHCLGGAAIGRTRAEGVCDRRNRVFGYRNMYICDGSMVGANLGVNPSLTITALTEHAMSHIPKKDAQKWDSMGEELGAPAAE